MVPILLAFLIIAGVLLWAAAHACVNQRARLADQELEIGRLGKELYDALAKAAPKTSPSMKAPEPATQQGHRDLDTLTLPGPNSGSEITTVRGYRPSAFMGSLRKSYNPVYDTFEFTAATYNEAIFTVPTGQMGDHGPKTRLDTNMTLGSCLGAPRAAYWTWIKLVIEDCDDKDLDLFLQSTTCRLIWGQGHVIFESSLSCFEPLLPYGADAQYVQQCKDAKVPHRLYVSKLGPQFIDSTDCFYVELNCIRRDWRQERPIRGKIILGPTLYVPNR